MTIQEARTVRVGDKVRVKKLTAKDNRMLESYCATGYKSGRVYKVVEVSLKKKKDIRPGNQHSLCLHRKGKDQADLYVPITVLEKA